MVGMNLSIFSWLFVIVERAIATAFLGKYESKCNGCIAPFLLCSGAALAVIVLFNISAYRKRHNSMMKLTNRYQLDENIRGGRYLIPVALNDVLVKLGAYQRVFFGLALTIRSQKLDHLFRRRKKTTKALEKQATAVNNYYADLKEMWS
ncbi:hypothetical protein OESDEN_07892 [Oesophagostomum dentatum]|uniref:Uncharacterized protein n=1 Tax=Oesophagostomum dentatum TaxID=61180 RepID=A0A0B1T4S5_OESDE|nr:hypothetical protein OESDEN_07892 [Oesophagostomum dentatum]